jgi:hypothetical protein
MQQVASLSAVRGKHVEEQTGHAFGPEQAPPPPGGRGDKECTRLKVFAFLAQRTIRLGHWQLSAAEAVIPTAAVYGTSKLVPFLRVSAHGRRALSNRIMREVKVSFCEKARLRSSPIPLFAKGHDFSRAENGEPKIDLFGAWATARINSCPFSPWPMFAKRHGFSHPQFHCSRKGTTSVVPRATGQRLFFGARATARINSCPFSPWPMSA